jgi:hypothetical protein
MRKNGIRPYATLARRHAGAPIRLVRLPLSRQPVPMTRSAELLDDYGAVLNEILACEEPLRFTAPT